MALFGIQDAKNFLDKGYNGNPLLKAKNVKIEWTPEMLSEFEKCSEDIVYFVETYIQIVTPDEGLVPFIMRDYQKELILSLKNDRFVIVSMARQSGKSETVRAFAIWYILFNSQKTIGLLANKEKTSIEMLTKLQNSYSHLPKWLMQGIVENNKTSFTIENGSRIISAATSASSIRGSTCQVLVIDEAAHVENWDEFYTSVFPTIAEGKSTKVCLISTPNGLNHFYKFWVDSENDKNEFIRHFVPWYRVPGRDERWRDTILQGMNGDLEKFDQEMNISFIGSSGTLIAGWKLKELVAHKTIAQSDGVYQYEAPIKNRRYVLIADVSQGKGLDYSTFSIIDVTTMPYKQVCVYRDNKIPPINFAGVIHMMGVAYNNAGILIEVNDMGGEVANAVLYEFENENVLFTTSKGMGAKGKQITFDYSGPGVDKGIRTSRTTKGQGCGLLKLLIEQNQLQVIDEESINELKTFSRKNASYEAEVNCHDDLVMTLVNFAWLSATIFFKSYTEISTVSSLRELSDEEVADRMLPFGYITQAAPIEDHRKIVQPPEWMYGPSDKNSPYMDEDPFSQDWIDLLNG